MNLYDAIMVAADHIEQNPELFFFKESNTPRHCGSRGCALGWIGYFGKVGSNSHIVGKALCGGGEQQFYNRMDLLTMGAGGWWTRNAAVCARGMRQYANIYFNSVWAVMRDREAQARIDAQPAYDKFRSGLVLESVPMSAPGNSVPSNEPVEDDEVL